MRKRCACGTDKSNVMRKESLTLRRTLQRPRYSSAANLNVMLSDAVPPLPSRFPSSREALAESSGLYDKDPFNWWSNETNDWCFIDFFASCLEESIWKYSKCENEFIDVPDVPDWLIERTNWIPYQCSLIWRTLCWICKIWCISSKKRTFMLI